MTHPTNDPEHTLSLSDLEVLEEDLDDVAEPNAHVRKDDSLLFAPAASAATAPDRRAPAAAPQSGVLALSDLVATYRPDTAAAGGLGALILPSPPRAAAPALSRGLVAALVVSSLALVSAVALAAHTARTPAPTAAQPPAPEPPRTTIAPLDPPPSLSMPRFEAPIAVVDPGSPEPREIAPRAPEATAPTRTTRRVATAPTKATPTKAPAPSPVRACGDEIECLLADDSDTPFEPARAAEPDPRRPESLDSFTISRTMKGATQRAARCDDTYGSGTVKVRVTVDGGGTATDVRITSTPSQPLAACVADAIRATDFPESRTGATFNYIFPFR